MTDSESTLGRAALVIAVALLAGGIALFFAPTVAESLPISLVVAEAGAVGAVALGGWVVRQRYQARLTETEIPPIEHGMTTPTPGSDIDSNLYRMTELRERVLEHRERIQERVGNIAVTVISSRNDCSRDDAIDILEGGSWTENDAAAGFFTGATTKSSLFEQIKTRFSRESNPYVAQLTETVTALEEAAEFDFDTTDMPDSAVEEFDESSDRGVEPDAVLTAEDGQEVTGNLRYLSLLRTHHWSGVSAFALIALAVGVLTSQPAVLVASAVAVGLAGYARIGSAPALTTLEVTRTVDETEPEPGDEIEVSVSVENTGETLLPDLTLVDRVPPGMRVVDGSARLGTALRPGDTAAFTYTAIAARGTHQWPLQIVARDPSGADERVALAVPDTTVECIHQLKTAAKMPVRMQTSVYSGGVATEIGGEGLEFYSVRDYQPGDPKRRIDWKSFARTGEMSTVDFREEHAARVVLLFDGRSGSYVSAGPGEVHAVDRAVEIGADVFASLSDQGNLVGLAAFNGIPLWLGPNTGQRHLEEVRQTFADHPAISTLPPAVAEQEEGRYVDPMVHIRRQLPRNSQIFLMSPLTDEYTYEVARQLNGAGHLVTVLSPDPTTGRTVGQRIARLERAVLIKQLRNHGIRVVEFEADRSVGVALERAKQRWTA
jgi:uncharacterized repeat protein (TIGR01451 family)